MGDHLGSLSNGCFFFADLFFAGVAVAMGKDGYFLLKIVAFSNCKAAANSKEKDKRVQGKCV